MTFNHPNARTEKRVVRIEPGESSLLDVTMDLGLASDGGKEGGT